MAVLVNRPARRRPQFHDLRVLEVQRLTSSAVAITLAVPADLAATFDFRAGQHLTLRATLDEAEVRRSYSCCLSPRQAREEGIIRVASAAVPGGVMSTRLNSQVGVGDLLSVLPPLGDFTCPTLPETRRHHLAIAGGSGITPVLSLITTALQEEPDSHVSLIFSNRDRESVMFADELAALEEQYPGRFRVCHVLTRDPGDPRAHGRLDATRLQALIDDFATAAGPVREWYLCGPEGLVDLARGVAQEGHADAGHVHTEVFHPGPA